MDFNNNTNNPIQNKGIYGNSLANSAMVLGILSILTALMMTVYFPFIFGAIAIVLALLSKGRARKTSIQAKTGIICTVIGLTFNLAIIGSTFAYIFSNPEILIQTAQTYDNMCEQIYGMPSEDILGDSMENMVDNFLDNMN